MIDVITAEHDDYSLVSARAFSVVTNLFEKLGDQIRHAVDVANGINAHILRKGRIGCLTRIGADMLKRIARMATKPMRMKP